MAALLRTVDAGMTVRLKCLRLLLIARKIMICPFVTIPTKYYPAMGYLHPELLGEARITPRKYDRYQAVLNVLVSTLLRGPEWKRLSKRRSKRRSKQSTSARR